MFTVMFSNESLAGQIEGFPPGFRPGPAQNRLRQHQQALRIRQQAADPSFVGRGAELVSILDAGMVGEEIADTVLGQRIEAQNLDFASSRYALQMLPVVGSEPVGFSAGQPEPRTPKPIELGANTVQRRAAVRRSGPHLVEPVDEQRRLVPLGSVVGVECNEIACGDVVPPAAFSLLPERHGLAGAGGAEQHVGIALPEIFQRPGGALGFGRGIVPAQQLEPIGGIIRSALRFDRNTVFTDLGACPRNEMTHELPGFRGGSGCLFRTTPEPASTETPKEGSPFAGKEGGGDVEALAELRESAQAFPARAALDLHGDQPPASHQDEVHLAAVVPPVMEAYFRCPRVE